MTEPAPFSVSYYPDNTLDAPEGHRWVRPSIDCPLCPCCSLALCQKAHDEESTCYHLGGGDQEGAHPLSPCPCAPLSGDRGPRPELPTTTEPEPDSAS